MQVSNRLKNQHLLWRAAFGPMAENAADLDGISQKKLWELLLKTSEKSPVKIDVASSMLDGLVKGMQDLGQMQKLTQEQRKAVQQQSREDIRNLNLRWMTEMTNSEAQFREKMSLFWHGHFACRVINILFQQQLLDILRRNAFGKFGDLLREVSKSPSMLQFLNNQQNRKQKPNENFAREVMELFTMGRGNYTENDVKEAARAFTGWGFNLQGEYIFRDNQHDDGSKTFLGKTGNFNGDDIIDILLEQKQTAIYITKKIYRYFVNEKVDEKKVEWLANRFYENEYDIKKLMSDIFTSDWFYEEKNIGTKIKSPVDLLVGIQRLLPLELENNAPLLLFQRALGQILFYPPNVAGWPGGKSWIDSSTLMLRLRIPQFLTANEAINIRPKSDDDVMMGQMTDEKGKLEKKAGYGVKNGVAVDWKMPVKIFEKVSRENLLPKISETVLQTKSRVSSNLLAKYLNSESRENYIKSTIINLMSTPEYQLC
ncbi:MAG: DUF1800 domain-containing protein [Ferruginibacter sp.]|nr:DUF1800 domain-containing protein [Ferruginibacter sp.]